MLEWFTSANDALMSFATSFEGTPWLFVIMWVFFVVDGICPIFPSESLVIALVALSISAGHPNVWLVFLTAAIGAFVGDMGAHFVGRRIGRRRLKILERPRVARIVEWAERMIIQRPAPVIISARYIPVGRVVVNLSTGRMRFDVRAFALIASIAAITWAAYSCLIGMLAGHWFEGHPIVSVCVGVVGGVSLGIIVDHIIRRLLKFKPSLRAQIPLEQPVSVPAGEN